MGILDSRAMIGLVGLVGTMGLSGSVLLLLLWRGIPLAQSGLYRWLCDRQVHFVACCIACYCLVFSVLALLKFQSYNMGMLDLGNFDQSLWNTLQGRIMYFTYDGWGPNVSLFVIHIEPIHLLVAPLYLLWPDARIILILQTLVIALGALPLYLLAHRYFPGRLLAVVFPMMYLLFPTVQFANLFDYHGDTLGMTFLLFAFWYLDSRHFYRYLLFLILALMCKEYIALLVLALGLYAWWVERARRFGVVAIVAGAIWILGVNSGLHYLFAGQTSPFIAPREYEIGRTPVEILTTITTNPIPFIRSTFTIQTIGSTLLLLVPTGFLAVLGYRVLWIGLPIYCGLLLFSMEFDIRSHHPATLIPVILVATIYGAVSLHRWGQHWPGVPAIFRERFSGALTGYLLSSAVCSSIILGPSPLSWQFWDPNGHGHGRYYFKSLYRYRVTQHDRMADWMITLIPPEATVCVSGHLAAHLTHRETCYIFPVPDGIRSADYILVDAIESYLGDHGLVSQDITQREEMHQAVTRLLTDKKFSLIAYQDGLFLFKRGANDQRGITFTIEETKLDTLRENQNIEISPKLRLIDYSIQQRTDGMVSFTWKWTVTQPLERQACLVTILRHGGQEYRIIHIPSFVIRGMNTWMPGELYTERFMIPLPAKWNMHDTEREIRLYRVPRNDALFFHGGTVLSRVQL